MSTCTWEPHAPVGSPTRLTLSPEYPPKFSLRDFRVAVGKLASPGEYAAVELSAIEATHLIRLTDGGGFLPAGLTTTPAPAYLGRYWRADIYLGAE